MRKSCLSLSKNQPVKEYVNARPELKLAYLKMYPKYRVDIDADDLDYFELPVFDSRIAGFELPDGGKTFMLNLYLFAFFPINMLLIMFFSSFFREMQILYHIDSRQQN